jgi:hypothetical protein
LTLLAISQTNNEILLKYKEKCAPFIFFAMHQALSDDAKLNKSEQSGEPVQSVWKDVWEDVTSGNVQE